MTVFQRRDSNDIDYVRPNSAAIWQATNFDKLHFTGVEASADYTPRQGQTIGVAFTGVARTQRQCERALMSKYTFNYPVQSAVAAVARSLGRHVIARTRIGRCEPAAA